MINKEIVDQVALPSVHLLTYFFCDRQIDLFETKESYISMNKHKKLVEETRQIQKLPNYYSQKYYYFLCYGMLLHNLNYHPRS